MIFLILFFLLLGNAFAGEVAAPLQADRVVPVRCVNPTTLAYEACGGGGAGGGDGAVLDGVDANIKATVFDRTNSNPLAAQLVDSNGDPVSVGGGTQYGQGSAATDTDQLMMAGCVRTDTAAVATGVVNGDRARCIVDATGQLWVHVGTIDGGVITTITNPVTVQQSTAANLKVDLSGTAANGTSINVNCASGCAGGTQYDEDTASGAADKITMAGAVRKDTAATLVDTDGDRTELQTDATGRLRVTAADTTQPVNTTQLGGTAIDTNSGTKSAGTQRVVLATDQPQLTNKLLVTPDSVALPANQSVNVSQINGVTPLMGNGTTGTGSQRVTIASDNTAFSVNAVQSGTWTVQPGNTANTTRWLVSSNLDQVGGSTIQAASNGLNTTGTGLMTEALTGQCDDTSPTALTENSFGHVRINCTNHALKNDVHSIAGTAVDSNTGNASAGSQRVVLASDQPAVTTRGANSNAIIACDTSVKLNMTTATTTEIVAISGSTTIYICSYSIIVSAATNVKVVRGTGTNCGTGTTDVSSNMHFTPSVASTTVGVTRGSGIGMVLKGAASGAICITSSAAVNVDVDMVVAQF